MHGGTIEARSEGAGRGSEFTVRLPLAGDVCAVARGAARRRGSPAARMRILVVDDNARRRRQPRHAPRGCSAPRCDVATTARGARGLRGDESRRGAARHRHAAAWTATRWRARCAPASPSAAPTLVALTGWGQAEDRRQAREAGFDHHLVKPAPLEMLEGPVEQRRAARLVPTVVARPAIRQIR